MIGRTFGARSAAGVVICAAVCLLLTPDAPAQDADQIGIYFGDPALGIAVGTAETYPAFDTAAIVLLNPSQVDVGGWELRVAIDGPGVVAGWQPVGQAVNFLTPPEFLIGLAAPLPAAPQVVLAQGPLIVTGPERVLFSLHPVYMPSLPGQMAYVPFEGMEPLTPLTTWTGSPVVASYHSTEPVCGVNPSALEFGSRPVGYATSLDLTITNLGDGLLPVHAVLAEGCDGFRITAGADPVLLVYEMQHTVTVEFAPETITTYLCDLDLGTLCGAIALHGAGREPQISASIIPDNLTFPEVEVGSVERRIVTVRNRGDDPFRVTPSVPSDCLGFSVSDTAPVELAPGDYVHLYVDFAPPAAGQFTCEIVLGDGLPTLPVSGVGVQPPDIDIVVVPAVLDFGTVEIWSVHTRTVAVTNTGTDPGSILPYVPSSCVGYAVSPSDVSIALAPGDTTYLEIRFAPEDVGTFTCEIALSGVNPSIPVTGTSFIPAGGIRVQPASLDFGGVAVGSWNEKSVTVINGSAEAVTLVPEFGGASTDFSLTGAPASIVVSPGGRHSVTVRFHPGSFASVTGELILAAELPVVPLSGVGEEQVVAWSVGPAVVDFGTVYAGGPRVESSLYVRNDGNATRAVLLSLQSAGLPCGMDSFGSVAILPGETHRRAVRFDPDAPGVYSAGIIVSDLLLGEIAVVPVTATAVADVPHCFVHPTTVEFGTVLVGMSAVQTAYVTNSGNEPLFCTPTTDRSDFICGSGAFMLATGETAALEIAFNPAAAGEQICILDLGAQICQPILLFGEGSDTLVPTHDLVGVWFDEELATGIRSDVAVGQAVPAWLALVNASEDAGVSGWELRLELDDGLQLVGHEIRGEHYNFEQPPAFYVGLSTPLPYGAQVVLATFEFLVTDTDVHAVGLQPSWRPSLPGHMAYVYGTDYQIKPMYPISGVPSVAWLTAGESVAVVAPAPTVRFDGSTVELSWLLPRTESEGCHVYRAVADRETRLTASPLPPANGGYSYVDDTTNLAPGATVAYSYGVVQRGTEIARSPSVSVQLPDAAAFMTRLLPNRPNPFNPATRIPFTVGRPGQVRIAVYDLTGRRVAVLEDGVRDAGNHLTSWAGRDDAGRTVPSGAYYVRLESASGNDTRKIMLLK